MYYNTGTNPNQLIFSAVIILLIQQLGVVDGHVINKIYRFSDLRTQYFIVLYKRNFRPVSM